jgi:hypothetical protein
MLRNLVPVRLSDQRDSASNPIYVYFIDPTRALPPAEKEKYLENEGYRKRANDLNFTTRTRIQANNDAIALELKKLGITLQRIAARQKKPFSSGSVRIRFCNTNTDNNTYNLVLEHHGIIEVHTDVPIPQAENDKTQNVDFSKISLPKDPQANQVVEDLDLDFSVIADGQQKAVFTSAYAGGTILNLELPVLPAVTADRENKFEDKVALLTPSQRTEALQLFPVQKNIIAQLDTHSAYLHATNNTIEDNQAVVDEITENIRAQTNLPEEAKALWQTAARTAATLDAELSAQNNLRAAAETELDYTADLPQPNLKQAAERGLLYHYGIYKGHEKLLLKPAENAMAKALRLTALQYFKSILAGFKVSKGLFTDNTNKKITEFNLKFAGIAIIKTLREPSSPEAPVLCFEQSLAKQNLLQLAGITNDLIIACTYYQGRISNSSALKLLTTNLEEKSDVNKKYTLDPIPYSIATAFFLAKPDEKPVKPQPFQWLKTISDVNKKAPPDDTLVLNKNIATFEQRIQAERTQVDTTTASIQALRTTVDNAIRETAARRAELAQLKAAATTSATSSQKGLAKQEEKVRVIELAKNDMVTTAKTRRSPELTALAPHDLDEKVENKFIRLAENLVTLRQETQAIHDHNTLIQGSNSVTEAQQFRARQNGHINNFVAARTKITTAIESLNGFKTILDKAEQEARRTDALEQQKQQALREADERAAALAREQQRLARVAEEKAANDVLQAEQQAREAAHLVEANRQKQKGNQQLVIETAKKLAHILSAVSYWHKQVRFWGGVNVPNPDGGTSSVPLGVSEMLKHKNTLNLAVLTYEDAVKFIGELKKVADIADQRGSWNCCYPVRKTGTTGALYRYVADFDILKPMQEKPSEMAFTVIYPGWKATYGVVNPRTPLLSDAPGVLHSPPRHS